MALAGSLGLIVTTLGLTTTTASAVDHFLETSHTLDCGKVTITLRNVSPWVYPVTVFIDGVHSRGPHIDNRTDTDGDGDLDVGGPQKDVTQTRTIPFPEDSGTHTVRYVVDSGTESDLYRGLPVGEWTELTVESDCIANVGPSATIGVPVDGGVYFTGQQVAADYSCADSDGTVASCVGTVADGAPIDTATPGVKTFDVTATDNSGATGTDTAAYTVVPLATECSGKAVNAVGKQLDLGSTGKETTPCVTNDVGVAEISIALGPQLPWPLNGLSGRLTVTLLEGTSENAGDTMRGTAQVEKIEAVMPLRGWSLTGTNFTAEAAATVTDCGSPTALSGKAEVGLLVSNGRRFERLTKPWSLRIPLLGTISANQVEKVGNTVTSSALKVDLFGKQGDFAIGEAVAGATC